MIIAADVNRTTKSKMIEFCRLHGVRCVEFGEKDLLSRAIGKSNYGLFGITKKSFSRAILERMSTEVK